ncbi:hypothetical protein [Paludisphaera borealis]|uniref:EF-hand domain-containing protein n=1 Tax=Paludisphaera borealis TaxID=1387353 RepID=A0A1U7CJQ8_9BACT|nr:hypothetical protein [Paludisphaera borealis]APW59175.1 hypothetical protein BSF38_00589 [Paludisphaera borealis]
MSRWKPSLLYFVVVLSLAGAASVFSAESPKRPGTKRALVICGIPGDDEHRALFAGAVEKIVSALTTRCGFEAADVFVRFGDPVTAGDGPALQKARGLSDRAGIEADAAELRNRAQPHDSVFVIAIGHGHFDDRHAHLNLPGPDLDEQEFGKLFEGLKTRDQVFMIGTPASGFFMKPLAAPGRIVITATEADHEVNETLFPLALVDVLTTPPEGIDRDKDGSISVFELYLAVVANVMKRYADDMFLPTEHARLDDNGDGRGSELQQAYLPAELGGSAKPRPPRAFGPKDDGSLASRTPFAAAPGPKPEAAKTK